MISKRPRYCGLMFHSPQITLKSQWIFGHQKITWLFQKYMWEHFCNRKSERVLFCPVKLLFRAYCIESKCLRQELIFVKFRLHPGAQKIKFSIKNFFSKWNQIRSIWSHLLMKSLIKNFFVLRMCVPWWLMN